MRNEIPTAKRQACAQRDDRRCLRCGGNGYQLHHRRGRAVRDDHTHCTCNLVTLCSVCHAWAHANPGLAMGQGWIVGRMTDRPSVVLVNTAQYGFAVLTCDGDLQLSEERTTADV